MSRYDDGTASALSELRHDFRSAADKGRDLFGIIVCDLIEVLDRPDDAGWGSRLPSVRPLTRYGSPFENHVWNRSYAWPDRSVLAAYYGAPERFDTWLALANRAYRATWDFLAILHNAAPAPFPRTGAIARANAAAWLATVHRLAWVAPADETLSTCRMTEFRPGPMTQWYEPADWDAWARDRARAGGFPSDHPDTLPSCWYSTLPEGLDLFSASAEAIRAISRILSKPVPADATPPKTQVRTEEKPEAAPSGLPLVRTDRKGRKYIVVNGRKCYEPPEWASKAYELESRNMKQSTIAMIIEKEERIPCDQSKVSRTIRAYKRWHGLNRESLCSRK